MRRRSTRTAGLLIVILGIWGGLVPFVGPYFHFAMGPTKSWTWTTDRFWLDVLPGIVAVLGGLMLLGAGPRPGGKLGALLALAAGIWFAIGPDVSLLWNASGAQGAAHGAKFVRVLEMVTYHPLLGAVIAGLAGYALPGLVTRRAEAAAADAEARAAPAAAGENAVATRQLPSVRREEVDAATRREPAVVPGETVRETEPQPVRESPRPDPGVDEPATTVMDRPVPGDPDDVPTAHSAAADPPPASPAAEAGPGGAVSVRRRRGGLLSRLRR